MYCKNKKLLWWFMLYSLIIAPTHAITPKPNSLYVPTADKMLYQGQFSDGQLQIELHAQLPYYTGILRFRGQQYQIQAQQQEAGLQGYFQDGQGNRFAFTAQLQGGVLDFATDGQHFQLRNNAMTVAPVTNPLSQAGSSAPITPPTQTAIPTPNIPQFIPQSPQAMLMQFHSLNTQIGYDFQLFLIRLRQWLSGNVEMVDNENVAQASKALMSQQLLPTALELQHKLAHLGVLSSQMGSIMQLKQQETKLMRQFITLSNKGSRFFEQWYLLLKLMLELHDSGDQRSLYQVAQEQLPGALKNAIAFARNFVVLVHAADNLQYRPLDAPPVNNKNVQPSLNPKQMFKWETLRNMSQMMRDAMRMMGAAGH